MPGAGVRAVCQMASFSRTQFYYSMKESEVRSPGRPCPGFTINRDGSKITDDVIVQHLKNYRAEVHFMNSGGAKMLSHYLATEHSLYVNHKKVYRLCRESNLLLFSSVQVRAKIKKKRCEYREVTAPNQLWQFDLKHVYIHGESAWCYVLSFIDVFSKKIVGYSIGKTIKSGNLILTLNSALVQEKISHDHPLQIRSDNGPQMSSNRFHFYLKKLERKLTHEFIPPRTPNRNAYIESFFSILEKTVIEARYFNTYHDAYEAIVDFIEFYNNRRLHGAIGNLSPMKFIEKFKNGEIKNYKISA
jgi:putative transposase